MFSARKDIVSNVLPALKWDHESAVASLSNLAILLLQRADDNLAWYRSAKAMKRRLAWPIRLLAILLTATAGILPILTQILSTPDGKPPFAPAWASVALSMAVVLVALDRFFGYSSGWMRYMTTSLQLKEARDAFELDWEAVNATFGGASPSASQIANALARMRTFTDQLNAIVARETERWVTEFQDALRQIDESAKTPLPVATTGSIAVVVENGEQLGSSGWDLSVDSGAVIHSSGRTAGITALAPGAHLLRVVANRGGFDIRAETVVNVAAGTIAPVSLTLA